MEKLNIAHNKNLVITFMDKLTKKKKKKCEKTANVFTWQIASVLIIVKCLMWLLLTDCTGLTFLFLFWMCGLIKSQLCIIVQRVHKWRIHLVKIKYALLIHSLFTLKWASFKNPCFWSRRYIYTCCRRTGCTPSGGDRGRCDVAFCLDRAPEWGKKEEDGRRIIWQFKSFISWQAELRALKSCSSEVWIQRWMWC